MSGIERFSITVSQIFSVTVSQIEAPQLAVLTAKGATLDSNGNLIVQGERIAAPSRLIFGRAGGSGAGREIARY
jgi:hypothetical protein